MGKFFFLLALLFYDRIVRAIWRRPEDAEEGLETLHDTADDARLEISQHVQAMPREAHTPEQEAVMDSIISRAESDLHGAVSDLERQSERAIRGILRSRLEADAFGGVSKEPEQLYVRDNSGKRWEPAAYAKLVMSTAKRELENTTSLYRAAQDGAPGVLVDDNEGPNSCEICRVANGQTWSLAYAAANKTEHPHCVRQFTALPAGWSQELDRWT